MRATIKTESRVCEMCIIDNITGKTVEFRHPVTGNYEKGVFVFTPEGPYSSSNYVLSNNKYLKDLRLGAVGEGSDFWQDVDATVRVFADDDKDPYFRAHYREALMQKLKDWRICKVAVKPAYLDLTYRHKRQADKFEYVRLHKFDELELCAASNKLTDEFGPPVVKFLKATSSNMITASFIDRQGNCGTELIVEEDEYGRTIACRKYHPSNIGLDMDTAIQEKARGKKEGSYTYWDI